MTKGVQKGTDLPGRLGAIQSAGEIRVRWGSGRGKTEDGNTADGRLES